MASVAFIILSAALILQALGSYYQGLQLDLLRQRVRWLERRQDLQLTRPPSNGFQ